MTTEMKIKMEIKVKAPYTLRPNSATPTTSLKKGSRFVDQKIASLQDVFGFTEDEAVETLRENTYLPVTEEQAVELRRDHDIRGIDWNLIDWKYEGLEDRLGINTGHN